MQEITQELLQSLFTYEDGNLYWKVQKGPRALIGDKVGGLDKSNGYYRVRINDKLYYNHRLIYLYNNGFIPKYLDHIDNDPTNNKIENLREVTNSQNCMNKKSYKNSSSEYKGVSWNNDHNKWESSIGIDYKQKHLGYFESETDAAIAYDNVAIELFGEYANLNEMVI